MILRHFSFGILFLSLFSIYNVSAISDDFSQDNWESWGDGTQYYDYQNGNKEDGSLYLSTTSTQKSTFYKKFKNLNNGDYSISFWIKGERIQKGEWDKSFWHFNDGGSGQKSCFEDIVGSFGWSLVKCPVKVTNKSLSLWFRLQSTGHVWIDDLKIENKKITKMEYSLNYENAKAFKFLNNKKCLSNSSHTSKKLYPRGEDFSPFDNFDKLTGEKVAILSHQKFYNLDVDVFSDIKWDSYDYLELILNVSKNGRSELQMAIEDIESKGYWSKLNFKSSLVSGENVILFPLKRAVGERGSTKDDRRIDYQALTKIWLSIDPDQKFSKNSKIQLKSISLKSKGHVKTFKDLYLFDFSEKNEDTFDCFNPVTPFHISNNEDDFGFSKKIKKVHDSIYADRLNRDTLLVNENEFNVKLPNGKYRVHLNWNMLGYWDVPFWHKRSITSQGKMIKIETRTKSNDYLQDYLKFENIEPVHGDHPWDLYLSEIFSPISFDVEVTNNRLNLAFSGDETGVALNWMAIYPLSKIKEGDEFLLNLDIQLKKEFALIGRYAPGEIEYSQATHISLQDAISRVRPLSNYNTTKRDIKITTFSEMNNLLNFVVFSNKSEDLQIDISSKHEQCISYELKKGQYQFISQDRNHETYIIGTKQLRTINSKVRVDIKVNNQILLDFFVNKECKSKKIEAIISFVLGDKNFTFPMSINVLKGSLNDLEIPVGFLGFNPLTFKYFKTEYNKDEIDKSITSWGNSYLDKILESGLSTFSTMGDINDPIFNNIMKRSKKSKQIKAVFTYGDDKSFSDFLLKSNKVELQSLQKKLKEWPRLIHTFTDEAGGYSDRLEEDYQLGLKFKRKAPFLSLGGFSSMDKSHRKLNGLLDEGSFSNINNAELKRIKNWGMYNLASLPLDNPQFAYGVGLYILKVKGLKHLVGWHMSAVQNYPYYDLDGRENDAMMLYPTTSGDLLTTIKFEQSLQGVLDYKLLTFLSNRASRSGAKGKDALKWLKKIKSSNVLQKSNGYFKTNPSEVLSSYKIREKVFYFLSNL